MDASLSGGRAAALFSATLTPPGYYRNVLGCPDARAVALESPFPPQHLGLYCLPSISTRYRDREASIRPPLRRAGGHGKKAKWATIWRFSPVTPTCGRCTRISRPATRTSPRWHRRADWTTPGGRHFWPGLRPTRKKTLLGFGVLGGIFGEGVDLAGDRLIGCAIVGVGLPQVNPRQEILRRYYDAAPRRHRL